ncbi:transporter [Pacificitalea manganoxidans]|uniref:Transporter n=1 Tax=Pacificitalea manganoxidans TaxID=1411902 RepID=A0A291LXG9_9RHOB|nr:MULTISPECIES: LysE family translocator [Paracoccaceae]ATI41337.1 transporter [Pacificitalea manganoxidans]MBF53111.1 transporter [Actibacterium sp.]MDR6308738.1 threonine/homoserine/homoserine lactone efflux protein [Pacificitalea manganoxidans]|tara:strand:- start:564 stop:1181 length:618 start_codon:yes stop_codon:yes gene_type:complete
MTLTAFLAVWLLHLMAAVSPGPAVLMAARTGLTQGARTGVALALGLGIGAVFWAALALSGLAIVFELAPGLLRVLKLAGAAYLLWLAWHMWRDARTPFDATLPPGAAVPGFRAALWRGLMCQLSNPKPAVFFGAVFAGAIPPETGLGGRLLLLAVIFVNESVWNSFVSRVFSLDRMRRRYVGMKTTLDRFFGGFLAVLGVKLATG